MTPIRVWGQDARRAPAIVAALSVTALLSGCGIESAQQAIRKGTAAEKSAVDSYVRNLPACAKVRKPRMISFNQTVNPKRMITLAAVGDVLLHDSVQRWAAGRPGGFAELFAPVADLIAAADVSFANLEGPAAAGIGKSGRAAKAPRRRYDGWVYSGYPMFNYHPSLATDLKRAGFDIVQTANNHSLDRYSLGADRTIDAVRKAGLGFTGTRKKGDRKSPWYTITPVRQGKRIWNIAWLGCTYGTNGIPDRHKQVLHCYDQRAELLRNVRLLAARRDVHAVIVTPHWGPEYRHRPDAKQRLLARQILEAGATAIVGTHPHVIQPVEKYVTRDGRETLVAYSLGNFVSNQIGLARRSSAILLLGLAADPKRAGKLTMAAMSWIPIWMRNTGGRMQAEAIDRVKHPRFHRRHLIRHLPAANLHPPKAPYWTGMACRYTPGQKIAGWAPGAGRPPMGRLTLSANGLPTGTRKGFGKQPARKRLAGKIRRNVAPAAGQVRGRAPRAVAKPAAVRR